MPKASDTRARILKRLMPLYVAVFFQGFVLWYATEKLFMTTIGFDEASIGLMIACYSAVMLLAETPSGVLADKWSRKGVLILGSIALALSALIGGISYNVPVFILGACIWGLFFAFYSGTYESVVYDTVLEETNKSDDYEYYFGRAQVYDSIALVASALLGALTANYTGLRSVYFITVPISLAGVIALLKFREPQLHKSHVAVPIKQHIRNTFRAVLRKGQLLSIMIVLITISILTYLVFEFSQVWIVTLAAPIILYGPFEAAKLSSIGLGGFAAAKYKLHRYAAMSVVLALLLVCGLALALVRNLWVIIITVALLCTCLYALRVVFTRKLHDHLSSNVRAGAASAVSTLARAIIIPLSLVFGYIGRQTDIFRASWILVILALIIAIFAIRTYRQNSTTN